MPSLECWAENKHSKFRVGLSNPNNQRTPEGLLPAHAQSHTSQGACHLGSKATTHPEEACRNLPNLRFFFSLKNVAAHPQAVPIPLHWLPTPFHERGLFPGGFSQLSSQSVSEGDEQVSPHEFFILQGKEGHHYKNKSSLVLPSMPELEMSVAPSSPPTGHSLVQLDPS